MANEKLQYQLTLRTTAEGNGAQQTAAGMKEVQAAALSADASLGELEAELQRLNALLRDARPASEEFSIISGRIGEVRSRIAQVNAQSDQFAAKAVNAAKSGSDMGHALLMLSQTADDAQYGIRGIVNNVGPLAMALGLGSGAAGIITILLVVINQLIPAQKKQTDASMEEADASNRLRDSIKSANDAIDKAVAARNKAASPDLKDALDAEKAALELQTRAFDANIEAMKKRLQIAGQIDKESTNAATFETQQQLDKNRSAIDQVNSKKVTGTITPQAAANELERLNQEQVALQEKLTTLKADAAQREIDRNIATEKLDVAAAENKQKAAEQLVEAAQKSRDAAEEEAKEREAQIQQLIRLQKAREFLDSQLKVLEGKASGINQPVGGRSDLLGKKPGDYSEEEIAKLRQLAAQTPDAGTGRGYDSERNLEIDAAKRLVDAIEQLADVQRQITDLQIRIGNEAPLPITGSKNSQGRDIPSAWDREMKRLTEGDSKSQLPSQEELNQQLQSLIEVFKEREADLRQATQEAQITRDAQAMSEAGQREVGGMQASNQSAQDAQGAIDRAADKAAEGLGSVLDRLVTALGSAGDKPEVKAKIDAIRKLLEGGLQPDEIDAGNELFRKLLSETAIANGERRGLYQQFLQIMEADRDEIARIKRQMEAMQSRQNSGG